MTRRRFTYDTEFIDDGRIIDLVSIGIVDLDDPGREFYAVSSEFDIPALLDNEWLRDNVWPHLPLTRTTWCKCPDGHLNLDHPDVMPRARILRGVQNFLLGPDPDTGPSVDLWAWYPAYDHVALMQLWGPMIAKPVRLPFSTRDIQQEADRLTDLGWAIELPEQPADAHDARADARHNVTLLRYLEGITMTGVVR